MTIDQSLLISELYHAEISEMKIGFTLAMIRYLRVMRNWFILMTMAFMFGSCGGEELQTVKQVDLDRYMGKWYEIVRLPNSFEDGLKCITAEYRLKENGKVEVRNAGTDIENGRRESSIGGNFRTARIRGLRRGNRSFGG